MKINKEVKALSTVRNDIIATVKLFGMAEKNEAKGETLIQKHAKEWYALGITPETITLTKKKADASDAPDVANEIVQIVEESICCAYFTPYERKTYLETENASKLEKDSKPHRAYKKVSKGMSMYKKRFSGKVRNALIAQGILTKEEKPERKDWEKVATQMTTLFNLVHKEDITVAKGINYNRVLALTMQLNDEIKGNTH